MRVEFLGGVRTVTGSATLLEKDSLKWLVDCGMHQGGKSLEERNQSIQPYHAPEEMAISEKVIPKEKEEVFTPTEPLSAIFRHLDRSYKRVR